MVFTKVVSDYIITLQQQACKKIDWETNAIHH